MFRSLIAALKKIPLSVFLGVLTLHAIVLWWLLGAHIALPAGPAVEPIIVTLEPADPEFDQRALKKTEPSSRPE